MQPIHLRTLVMLTIVLITSFAVSVNADEYTLDWQLTQLPKKASLRGSAMMGSSLWVSGSNNTVFVSQDGGKTWHDKSVNHSTITDFRDIALFNNQTAIVMGAGSGELSTLFKTTDGGNSWHAIYQTPHKQGFFDSIAFWDNRQGLLMGDPIDGYFVIKRTLDGGKTWQRIKQQHIPALKEKEAAFAASGNTLITGKSGKAWFTTGGFSAWVYHSDDYGETWQRTAVPIHQTTQTSGGYALGINNLDEIFVLGGDYLTRDGSYHNTAQLRSNTWQAINTGNHGLRTAMACQQTICISTGKLGSDISYDNGNNWQVLKRPSHSQKPINTIESPTLPTTDQGFYTLASDNNTFLAAGAKGSIAVITLKANL